MQDPNDLQQQILQQHDVLQQQREALQQLQEAKLKALQDTIGNYGNFRYVNLNDFLDPDNKNWQDYKWSRLPAFESAKRQEHINAGTPVGMLIQQIRDAENIDDVKKQLELWDTYKPLDSPDNGKTYIRYFIPGYGMHVTTPYGGSRPVFPTTDESDSVQTTAGGTQGVQGAQADVKTGNAVARGGTQGSNNGSGGTFASAGVAKGGTKTIGYDPNPGNVSLAYAMRNAPEQERRTALIDKWNREHGNLSRSGGNIYASAGIPRGGIVSSATMMRTSGVQPVQAAYGNNAPMGEGFDYTRTYDPMSNSMRPNDSYSYYDPSRNAPSGGDGTDLTLTYDPMTGQMIRR